MYIIKHIVLIYLHSKFKTSSNKQVYIDLDYKSNSFLKKTSSRANEREGLLVYIT
jgi:hypothetical protein